MDRWLLYGLGVLSPVWLFGIGLWLLVVTYPWRVEMFIQDRWIWPWHLHRAQVEYSGGEDDD